MKLDTIFRRYCHLFILFALASPLGAELPELRLVQRIAFLDIRQKIVNDNPNMQQLAKNWPHDTYNGEWTPYGFLKEGREVHFGMGGWVLDLESEKLVMRYPSDLRDTVFSPDGQFLLAMRDVTSGIWFYAPSGATEIKLKHDMEYSKRRKRRRKFVWHAWNAMHDLPNAFPIPADE